MYPIDSDIILLCIAIISKQLTDSHSHVYPERYIIVMHAVKDCIIIYIENNTDKQIHTWQPLKYKRLSIWECISEHR